MFISFCNKFFWYSTRKIVTLFFMKIKKIIVGLALLFPVSVFAAGASAGDEAGLYKAKCASCHGGAGEGSAKIAKMLKLDEAKLALASAKTQKASDGALLKVLLEGKEKMPSYKGKISDEEAKKLIQYIRTLKK